MKIKFPQTCYKSEINYNDIDNEIARLEMERQSVETEYKVLCNKLQGCLDNKNWDEKEYDRIFREFGRRQDRLFYLNEKIIGCQMVKDGSVPLPKPRTDRSWSEDPFFDMILAEQHRKKKEMGIEAWREYMNREIDREMERDMFDV